MNKIVTYEIAIRAGSLESVVTDFFNSGWAYTSPEPVISLKEVTAFKLSVDIPTAEAVAGSKRFGSYEDEDILLSTRIAGS